MTEFCEENEIPVWTCGKLIVATKESDLPKIDNLYERGTQNKVEGLRVVSQEEIKKLNHMSVPLRHYMHQELELLITLRSLKYMLINLGIVVERYF